MRIPLAMAHQHAVVFGAVHGIRQEVLRHSTQQSWIGTRPCTRADPIESRSRNAMADLRARPLGLRSWPGRGAAVHPDVPVAPAAVRLSPTTETLQPLPAGRAMAAGSAHPRFSPGRRTRRVGCMAATARASCRCVDSDADGGSSGAPAIARCSDQRVVQTVETACAEANVASDCRRRTVTWFLPSLW